MKNKRKKIIFDLLLFFIFSIILFIPYFKPHYSLDNYTIKNYGYDYYGKNWSLLGGRLFMFVLLKIADICNIPVETFIVICELIAIIVSCISTTILKQIIVGYKQPKNKLEKIIIYLVSYFTIFNFMYIDCMLYIECSVMSISILLYLISANALVKKTEKYILKNYILLLIAVFCYQGSICMYFAFIALFSIIENKEKYKNILKDILKSLLIALSVILINVLFIKIIENFLEIEQARISNPNKILDCLKFGAKRFYGILEDTCYLFPKYMFLTYLLILTGIIIGFKIVKLKEYKKQNIIINYLLLITICILSTFTFFIMTKSSFYCGRMRLSIGALFYIIVIYMYTNDFLRINTLFSIFIIYITIVYCLVTIGMYEFMIYIRHDINKQDKQKAEEINQYITQYEKETGTEVKYVFELYNPKEIDKGLYYNIKELGISAIRFHEISVSAINVYTGRKLKSLGGINIELLELSGKMKEDGYECKKDILYIEINVS